MCRVGFEDPLAIREEDSGRARIRASLASALSGLSSDDRGLLALRYWQRRSVQTVAQTLQTDPKALYRRFDRVLRSLRRRLLAQGISGSSAINLQ